jgi:hypothetical protein
LQLNETYISKHKHDGSVDDRFIGFVALGYFIAKLSFQFNAKMSHVSYWPVYLFVCVRRGFTTGRRRVPVVMKASPTIVAVTGEGRAPSAGRA